MCSHIWRRLKVRQSENKSNKSTEFSDKPHRYYMAISQQHELIKLFMLVFYYVVLDDYHQPN